MKDQCSHRYIYLVLCVCFILGGCSSKQQTSRVLQLPVAVSQQQHLMVLIQQEWQGTPYRLGGHSKQGVDCSAFVQHVYSRLYDRQLPRTTELQLALGFRIPLSKAQSGDLIFFKTGKKARHVGVLFNQHYFLHASTSQGVIFSRLDNLYWSTRILAIKRSFI